MQSVLPSTRPRTAAPLADPGSGAAIHGSGVGVTVDDVCMALTPVASRPLVGRAQELTTLLELLGISGDAGGMVLLGGDAGVGKTRLLAELAARAETAGWQVLVGHCVDSGEVALPYLPFTEVFGLLAARTPTVVRALIDAHPPLARLLPARRMDQAHAADADRLDRVELLESVHAGFDDLGRDTPVLLIVEDAHWADRSTRELLTTLFTRGFQHQVSVAVSYRADDLHRRHPLRASVAEWGRLPSVTRLTVPPLADTAVRELVGTVLVSPLPEQELRGIVERSEGNAFFAEELAAAAGLSARLPEQLADLLLIRMEGLDDDARRTVRAAAVAGRSVTHELLACITGLDRDRLDRAIRTAVEARILVPAPPTRYAFRHALMAEAVYDDLLPGEREHLHGRYTEVLGSGQVPATAAELARHARAARDRPVALAASIRAGDEAMAVGGPEDAAHHYELALGLVDPDGSLPGSPNTPSVDVIELTVKAAEAAAASGHVLRAVAMVQHALDTLPEARGGPGRGNLLVSLASLCVLADTGTDLHAVTTEALGLVPDDPTPLRGALLNLHARACSERNRFDEAARWAEKALALGTRLGRTDVSSHARTTLAHLEVRVGDPRSALAGLEQTLAQARESRDVGSELRASYSLGSFHYEAGQFESARAAFEQTVRRAQQSGRPWTPYAVEARCMIGQVAYVTGAWDDVAAILDATGEAPPRLSAALLAATSLQVPAARGDTGALVTLQRLRDAWHQDGLVALRCGSAEVELALATGDLTSAVGTYDELCATVTALWRTEPFLAQVRLAALLLGGACRAAGRAGREEHRPLLELAERVVADAGAAVATRQDRGGVMGPEGLAWQVRLYAEQLRLRWLTQSDPPGEADLDHAWQRSVESFAAFGEGFETARSRTRWAGVLLALGRGEQASAQVLLARETARALRADPLLAELRTVAPRGVSAGPDETSTTADHLTPREQQVLELVAQGRTNRQVASQLFISEKTVSVHMSNILAKVGAGGRTEAVAIARRRGLLVDD